MRRWSRCESGRKTDWNGTQAAAFGLGLGFVGKIPPMTFIPDTAKPTAILSALLEEQRGLVELLEQPRKVSHAGRDFWCGTLHGQRVVLALSKIGKVAAATTATALIERFGVQRIIFTGVAGGLGAAVNVGGYAARMPWVTPRRFTSITSSQSAGSYPPISPETAIPALLNR